MNAVQGLPVEKLDHLISNDSGLAEIFTPSDHLFESIPAYPGWKKSLAILAYLFFQKSFSEQRHSNLLEAGRIMLRVRLEPGSPFDDLAYQIAGHLRESEKDKEAVGSALRLIQEFLRVQERGTPKHFLGVIELGCSCIIEYFGHPVHPPLFAFALELFREAMSLSGVDSWPVQGRRVLFLGRILHNRLKYFAESNTCLDTTIKLFNSLWDLIPAGRPFRASVLEMLILSSLLFLSREVPTNRWVESLKLLGLIVELRIYGAIEGDGLDGFDIKNISAVSEDVLENGLNPAPFNFASEPICLAHISDIMRSLALDCSSHPGFLTLSLNVYCRSLRSASDLPKLPGTEKRDVLRNACTVERDLLRSLVLECTRNKTSLSSLIIEPTPLTIFRYSATTMTGHSVATSLSHMCVLVYYPTWTSTRQLVLPPDSSSNSVTSDPSGDPNPSWPDNLLDIPGSTVLPPSSDKALPSTIIPGIENVLQDEFNDIFKLPLEPRTIRTLIRFLKSEVRGVDADVSMLTAGLVSQLADEQYWDPSDVQLSTRLENLKSRTAYIGQFGPLQALLSRGPERSLELVEASRSLFWTRLLRLRTNFEGLPESLGRELDDVAQALEKCKSQSVASVTRDELQVQFDLELTFRHLLQNARQVPGFENLLKSKTYHMLTEAASSGPIVVLLGGNSVYAALTVRAREGVEYILLPGLNDKLLDKMVVVLNRATKAARGGADANTRVEDVLEESTERFGRPRPAPQTATYETLLDDMWKVIAHPILDFLGLLSVRTLVASCII